jgi:LmbE family N-acetylglucosaminyl deacetylase
MKMNPPALTERKKSGMVRLTARMLIALLSGAAGAVGQPATLPGPDGRMKVDILLIVAHPDDETAVGGYLAKSVFDERRRVAVIYCNRGTGGGNSAGSEQAGAMGAIREIEARQALAKFGITNAWFLGGKDTPGQDVFASLESWHHGALLEEVVRLVRLTRPEVILTWLPHFVAGENHGDHQAAGVLAVESFDLAGNPTAFPAQVTPPRERLDIANATEGLHPWQPKKVYFFSDASHEIQGEGPAFDLDQVSASQQEPYFKLAAKLHVPHRTQADVSQIADEAFKTGNFDPLKQWLGRIHLLFGKSVVPARPGGDVFEGVTAGALAFVPADGYVPPARKGTGMELGGPFAFYKDFWRAHGIERVGPLAKPEIELTAGSYLHVPLLITNGTADSVTATLSSSLPEGWKEAAGSGRLRIGPGETCPVQTFVRCPSEATADPLPVIWTMIVGGTTAVSDTIQVKLVEWALPQ